LNWLAERGAQPIGLFRNRQGGIDERGGDAAPCKTIDLIFHQRNERRDDKRRAWQLQRGELVDQRLARAGGHDDEGIAFIQDVLKRGFLAGTKSGEVEVLMQGRKKINFRHATIIQ
jgi:hypothetical protein